jgi:hypothetical protein
MILGVLASIASSAELRPRIPDKTDPAENFILPNHVPAKVSSGQAIDEGPAPRHQNLPQLYLHFAMTPAQQTDLTQFLQALQDRRSPQYHHFLTPEQYAERFGLAPADIAKVTRWLEENGFSHLHTARGGNWISFSGPVHKVESAFHTSIHRYSLGGETHFANATNPELPQTLSGVVSAIRGLHNFPLRPRIHQSHPHFTSSITGEHYLAPNDWATIYDVQPLYGSGINGSGVTIAVVGQSDVELSDLAAFRSAAGLPAKNPTVVVPPGDQDPGIYNTNGDETESDLDLEWAGAIASNANILFITASSIHGNGVQDSITYAIDNNVAPILSTSYGQCEANLTLSEFNAQSALYQEANALGMTIVAAAGDDGAADCDYSPTETAATQGLAVDFPASSQYVTGIGGTRFNEGSGNYWSLTNNSSNGSALSYIPEVVWNDGFEDATGGGASTLVSKPIWQTGTGVPADAARDVPDLAFTASPNHDAYLICSNGSCTNGFRDSSNNLDVIGGTSAGAPTFSAVLALVIQQSDSSTRLGNINPNLYSLAAISPNAFHDITGGNNETACQTGTPNCPAGGYYGFAAGVGYDQTTGWGSIDANNFAEQWYGDFQITASPTTLTIQPGAFATSTINLATVANFTGNVTFSCSVSSNLYGVTCSVPPGPLTAPGTTTVTITAAANARMTPKLPKLPPTFRRLPPVLLLLPLIALLFSARKPLRGLTAVCPRFAMTGFRPLYVLSSTLFLAIAFGAVSCGGGGTSVTSTVTSTESTLGISCTIPGATEGTAYTGSCIAVGGAAPFSFSISSGTLPAGLSLNTSTGAITGTPKASGTFSFTVEVTDSSSPEQTATQSDNTFITAPPTLDVTCVLPTGAMSGVPYSGSCSAAGGTAPYIYAISAGALPAGLTLNGSSGAITGIPVVPGSSAFNVRVTDSGSPAQSKILPVTSFTVTPGPLALSCSVSSGQATQPYSGMCAASGGNYPYVFSVLAGTLPAGLSLNPQSGAITGVPTIAGTYPLYLQVADSASLTAVQQITIAIAPVQPFTLSCLAGAATVGTTYTAAPLCSTSGGTAPYSYELVSGGFPYGLTFNVANGTYSGTPTAAGTFTFLVFVNDSSMPSFQAEQRVSFMVSPGALMLNCAAPSGQAGQTYAGSCSAAGGTAPYTYSLSAGMLPAGLSLNAATGAITGMPTLAGTYPITIKATDSESPAQAITQAISLVIAPAQPLTLTCTPFAAVVGTAYTNHAFCTATGGTVPYTYSISAGTLPTGLTLNAATGTVSGTPTASATFASTAQVADSSSPSASATQAVSFVVAPHPSETGTVTITATAGGITSTTTITVTIP